MICLSIGDKQFLLNYEEDRDIKKKNIKNPISFISFTSFITLLETYYIEGLVKY